MSNHKLTNIQFVIVLNVQFVIVLSLQVVGVPGQQPEPRLQAENIAQYFIYTLLDFKILSARWVCLAYV